MEYNSFYGGRRGASFVIVKRYSTIAEMIAAFSQGGDYKTVNYDEYVLIDTENKNDADNGKIYRRGYEYNNDLGGAIYEGQIVGPAGMAPHTEMHTIDEVEQIQEREGFTYRRGSGSYSPVGENIVPGKYIESGTIKYNDSISWEYCSVRDSNSHESTAHIGFKFPYTIIDYVTESVKTYDNSGNYTDTSDAIRIDDETHPFYEKWKIKIPKGVKGTSAVNITLAEATADIENYTDKASDIANHRKVLTYNELSFDNKENGELGAKKYIGKVNEIQETAIDSRYHLLIYYSDPAVRAAIVDPVTYDGKTDWADMGYIGNGTGVGAIVGEESESAVATIANTMPPYSAWLIVEEDEGPGSI